MTTRHVTANIDPADAHDWTITATDGTTIIDIARMCPHEIVSIVIVPAAPTELFPDTLSEDQPTPPPAPVVTAKSK
jgi:hypothetical protein